MTDRTLSAAELDLVARAIDSHSNEDAPFQIDVLLMAKFLAAARRTEAAERKLAKIEAECSRLEFAGGRGTVSCDFIRRALAED